MHFILETYVRKVSPYQGKGMICSSSFGVCVTGLREGRRNLSCFVSSWMLSEYAYDEAWTENVCCCETCLSPLALVTPIILKKLNCQMFISLEKARGGGGGNKTKRSTFVSTLAHLTFSRKPSTIAFFVGLWGWGGVEWQKYITAAALSGDWTTGFMWREEDWSSCNRLFLLPFATPLLLHALSAVPFQNLLTSFSSQFDVYFPIYPVTNC